MHGSFLISIAYSLRIHKDTEYRQINVQYDVEKKFVGVKSDVTNSMEYLMRNLLKSQTLWFSVILVLLNNVIFAEGLQSGIVEGRDTNGLSIEFVSSVKTLEEGKTFKLGFKLQHDDGFHSYWKNPGVVGVPLTLSWKLPEGFKASTISWPYPERSKMADFACFGYERDVLLMVEITAPKTIEANQVKLSVDAHWMCCSSVCHPGQKTFTMSLPVGSEVKDTALAKDFDTAWKEVPQANGNITAKLLSGSDDKQIRVRIGLPESTQALFVFNSDNQTTPDLNSTLVKEAEGTWVYSAQRSKFGTQSSEFFTFVLKTNTGYFEVVAR